jgi:hypothetical protein
MDEFIFYTEFGLTHVLDVQAYDHVLFFIVLTINYGFKDWKKALWLITFFTIGHTLTLTLSTYHLIYVKMDIVEFLIPLTIFITAFYNISTSKKIHKNKTIGSFFAFTFGLIHGLGFSGAIRILIDDTDQKFLPIMEFALGIEIAQIVVVLIIFSLGFFVLNLFKIKKRDMVLVASSVVIGLIIPMLIERKFW